MNHEERLQLLFTPGTLFTFELWENLPKNGIIKFLSADKHAGVLLNVIEQPHFVYVGKVNRVKLNKNPEHDTSRIVHVASNTAIVVSNQFIKNFGVVVEI